MAKQIALTQGKFAIVDDEDYERIKSQKWNYSSGGYAVSPLGRMHRVILNCSIGFEIDHINRDKLDNRKENLRVCSRHENNANKGKYKNNKSGYKGVDFYPPLGKYRAQLKRMGIKMHIGYYKTAIEAAKAYDKKAVEIFGEFASINGVEEGIK